ncbi:N-methyl-L-tryptophan oxidase [Dehalococcoidia bacterium]|nr:N-methyl-L-tryptophan oxidase [Dehalococcoidia bacterium]
MVKNSADVLVIGLGAHGSAATYNLSRNGLKVIGFDTYHPPHDMGSSHGQARIIRKAYSEGPHYVPLVSRSYDLFFQLQELTGAKMINITGGLQVGRKGSLRLSSIKESADIHGCEIEFMTADEVRSTWNIFEPEDNMDAVLDIMGGAVFPEKVIDAHLQLARINGADLKFNHKIVNWDASSSGVRVETESGDEFFGDKLIISAGAWAHKLCLDLSLPLSIERQVLFWFKPISNNDMFLPGNSPNHSWEYESGHTIYIQPNYGRGVKAAIHHDGLEVDPDTLDRNNVLRSEEKKLISIIRRYVPSLPGEVIGRSVCMYTNTPDLEFIIDFHPEHSNVLILSPCSGHGFKFSPVVGEIAFNLLTEGNSEFDLMPFSINRFT